MAIADRLSHHDDIGHHVLQFESPKALAHTSESDLDLVGDTEAACLAHIVKGGFEVAVGMNNLAADAGAAFDDECGNLPAVCT